MRQRTITVLLFMSCAFLSCLVSEASANIIIKVRALNPLETEEVASIRYPLPQEITPSHIITKNISFSLPLAEVEEGEEVEERKSTFNIEYVEEEGRYFIIDEIKMGPREVITLETHVQDIWFIASERFGNIRQTVEDLIARFPPTPPEATEEDPDSIEVLSDETAIALQEEIFKQLDEITVRQLKSSVLLIGVEQHMEAYYENMEALAQVEDDVFMLRNLLEPDEEEGEEGVQDLKEDGAVELPEETEILEETALFADPTDSAIEGEMLEPEIDLSE